MRHALTGVALTLALTTGAGCTSPAAAPPLASGSSTATPAPAPETAAVCARARVVILAATERFSTAMARAVAAGETGEVPKRDAAMSELRSAFADWAAGLRSTADQAKEPQLEATLLAYAGAVDAAIARVRTFADLDTLYTFDDQELDVMASQFHDACP